MFYYFIQNFYSVLKSIGEKKYDDAFRGQLAILQNIVKYLQSDSENWMVPLANTVIIYNGFKKLSVLIIILSLYVVDLCRS